MLNNKNLPIMFTTLIFAITSCSDTSTGTSQSLNIGSAEVVETIPSEDQINSYLAKTVLTPNEQGRPIICSHELLNAKQGLENKVYVIASCQEQSEFDADIAPTGVANLPVLFKLNPTHPTQILSHQTPRDGSLNRPDIESMFPESVWK